MPDSTMNYNNAISTSFKLEIEGLEDFTYFVQRTSMPQVECSAIPVPFQKWQVKLPDNVIVYEDLVVEFLVDEDFVNYDALFKWLLRARDANSPLIAECFKEISLFRLSSNKVPIAEIVFHDAFPTTLSDIPLQSNTSTADPLTCTVRFSYQTFNINPLQKA